MQYHTALKSLECFFISVCNACISNDQLLPPFPSPCLAGAILNPRITADVAIYNCLTCLLYTMLDPYKEIQYSLHEKLPQNQLNGQQRRLFIGFPVLLALQTAPHWCHPRHDHSYLKSQKSHRTSAESNDCHQPTAGMSGLPKHYSFIAFLWLFPWTFWRQGVVRRSTFYANIYVALILSQSNKPTIETYADVQGETFMYRRDEDDLRRRC